MVHKYELESTSMTTDLLLFSDLNAAGLTVSDVVNKIDEATRAEAPAQLMQQFTAEGYDVTSVTVLDVRVTVARNVPRTGMQVFVWYKAEILSNTPIETSPLDPVTWAIIIAILKLVIKAIVLIVVAYFAIQAIERFFTSMITTTTRIRKMDPETGEVIYDETRTEPSPVGIAGFGIIFIVIVVILLIFTVGLPSLKRKG